MARQGFVTRAPLVKRLASLLAGLPDGSLRHIFAVNKLSKPVWAHEQG
jgi:hypothetical protein